MESKSILEFSKLARQPLMRFKLNEKAIVISCLGLSIFFLTVSNRDYSLILGGSILLLGVIETFLALKRKKYFITSFSEVTNKSFKIKLLKWGKTYLDDTFEFQDIKIDIQKVPKGRSYEEKVIFTIRGKQFDIYQDAFFKFSHIQKLKPYLPDE